MLSSDRVVEVVVVGNCFVFNDGALCVCREWEFLANFIALWKLLEGGRFIFSAMRIRFGSWIRKRLASGGANMVDGKRMIDFRIDWVRILGGVLWIASLLIGCRSRIS